MEITHYRLKMCVLIYLMDLGNGNSGKSKITPGELIKLENPEYINDSDICLSQEIRYIPRQEECVFVHTKGR